MVSVQALDDLMHSKGAARELQCLQVCLTSLQHVTANSLSVGMTQCFSVSYD